MRNCKQKRRKEAGKEAKVGPGCGDPGPLEARQVRAAGRSCVSRQVALRRGKSDGWAAAAPGPRSALPAGRVAGKPACTELPGVSGGAGREVKAKDALPVAERALEGGGEPH